MGDGLSRALLVVRGMLDLLCKSETGGSLGDEEEAAERARRASKQAARPRRQRAKQQASQPASSKVGRYLSSSSSKQAALRYLAAYCLHASPSTRSHPLNPLYPPTHTTTGIGTSTGSHRAPGLIRTDGQQARALFGLDGQWCLARGCACFCSAEDAEGPEGHLRPRGLAGACLERGRAD